MERGLFYPVDFASSGSSQIGGNISTNAGGIKVIRHGMTRDWVAGLKVVNGTGELLDLNRGLIKNNAGYDLRQLVIGAEGTLGVVVEATMRLTTPPQESAVLVLGAPDMTSIMHILRTYQDSIELSAFEFFSELALQKVVEHQGLQRPFETATEFYALLEFEQRDEKVMEQAMSPVRTLRGAGLGSRWRGESKPCSGRVSVASAGGYFGNHFALDALQKRYIHSDFPRPRIPCCGGSCG